jgi:CO/xanthine dehydrogenase FAD-binding subunit
MIAHDLVYFGPQTVEEALDAWKQAEEEGLDPAWVSGGTEVVTMVRDGRMRPTALVDLKGIAELGGIEERAGRIRFGGCSTLNELVEDGRFGLLAAAAAGVADHSVRNTITLAGNVAGRLPYREAVLPLLLADAHVELVGSEGGGRHPINSIFDKRIRIAAGRFVVAFDVEREATGLAWFHARRTRNSRVDYPLLTLCALRSEAEIRFAVSGLFVFPAVLGAVAPGTPQEVAAGELLAALDARVRSDLRGSDNYRRALFEQCVGEALEALGA